MVSGCVRLGISKKASPSDSIKRITEWKGICWTVSFDRMTINPEFTDFRVAVSTLPLLNEIPISLPIYFESMFSTIHVF